MKWVSKQRKICFSEDISIKKMKKFAERANVKNIVYYGNHNQPHRYRRAGFSF